MPKKIPEQEFEAIVEIVAAHSDGVLVGTIRDGLVSNFPPRMLQRRLERLIAQKRLCAEGRGKGRRYRVPSGEVVIDTTPGKFEIKGHPARLTNPFIYRLRPGSICMVWGAPQKIGGRPAPMCGRFTTAC